jgi:hypothetical protein
MVPKRQNQTKMNMKVFFFFICLLLVSCVAQNEFGIHRYSKSKYKIEANTNDEAYSIIDTNSIYKFIKDKRINISQGSLHPFYYKFYSNGRIAWFDSYLIDFKKDPTLEAKKAHMGFYNFNGKDFIVQFYNSNMNAAELTNEILSVQNDTMILTKTYTDAEIKSYFLKEIIPKNVNITKPDW